MSDPEARAALLRRMLVFVAAQPVGFGDWACVECRPESDMLVSDFRCLVHEARAALAALPDDGREQAADSRGPREVLTDALMRGPGRYSRSGSQALAERLLLALEDAGYVIGEARP